MRRADRLFQIVQHLRGRRLTTAEWLAQRLQVSRRTIYRDVQDLMLSGVPIEGEAGVGYMVRHGLDLPPLMFSREQIEALVVGARLVRRFAGGALAQSAQSALDKIEAVLPEELRARVEQTRVFVPHFAADEKTSKLFDGVHLALNQRRFIAIRYTRADGELSLRTLRPLGLYFWGAVWTLAAWCELRQDYRSFRIDRIQQLDLLAEQFAEDGGITLQEFINCQYRQCDAERARPPDVTS